MPEDDRIAAKAMRDSPALAELAEFAGHAPHLDFGLARRRAIVDALLRQPSNRPTQRVGPAHCVLVPSASARKQT